MLYKQNGNKRLSDELFRNPGSEYRATPFWAWNCELQIEELKRQIDVFQKMGFGGFHMHVRTGMATPYLSDEYMQLIRQCTEKAKENSMLAWLYDEDRWPSGAAGGLVTKEKKYRARYLLFTPVPYGEDRETETVENSTARAARTENGELLACYDVVLDENGCLGRYRQIAPDEAAEGVKWYAYLETPDPNPWYNNQTYVNTLDKAAIDRFIEITYESYRRTVSEEFGKTIPAIFTDEPQFSHKTTLGFAAERKDITIPWSEDVPKTFFDAYGEDLMAGLPELFWELPDGKVSVIRYHYHDHIAERFAQAFADNCGKWCREHGIALTGHMMEEETLNSQTAALGETMRSYRGFDLPGIDMLCARREFTTAKQAQSASRQFGREGVMSELYGVTGWNFDFRGHKLHGDWQAALGVTVRVPHLSWVSMKGEAKRDYPASINYQSPWYREYSYVEDHFARVNTAMTRGKPVVRVGVIHPVESYWLHWGPNEQTATIRRQMDENFQNLTKWLLFGSVDFDFISESLLPMQCEQGGASLKVGSMAYDVVIVPGCETLRSGTLERLERFVDGGGKLVFLGKAPVLENAVPSERGQRLYRRSTAAAFEMMDVLDAVEGVRMIDIRNEDGTRASRYLHQLRRDGERLWLFVAQGADPYNKDVSSANSIRISINGEYAPTLYNTQDGSVREMDFRIQNGKTYVEYTLYDYDSLLIALDPAGANKGRAAEQKPAPAVKQVCSVAPTVDYSLSEPNVLLLDQCEYALDGEPYAPSEEILRADNICRERLGWPTRKEAVAQPWVLEPEAPTHTLTLRFAVESEIAVNGAKLALEDAALAKVICNGEEVPANVDGWYADRCIGTIPLPALNAGVNELIVTLPFGRRTNPEWCYIVGEFGVRVQGRGKTIVPLQEKLAFDDIKDQGLPFYGGNITYHLPVRTTGGALEVRIPQYDGALTKAALNGASEHVVYPPYRCRFDAVPAGEHTVDITLFGNRDHAFGPVHLADKAETWIGPNAWRSEGDCWTYEYRFSPLGVMSSPQITELE